MLVCDQLLVVSITVVSNESVGKIDDLIRAAIVAFQSHRPRARKVTSEV